jgi:hypothetical protein
MPQEKTCGILAAGSSKLIQLSFCRRLCSLIYCKKRVGLNRILMDAAKED